MKLDDVHKVTKALIKPNNLQWFVVGDKEKILPGLKELGFDEVILVDTDGNPVGGKVMEKVKKP